MQKLLLNLIVLLLPFFISAQEDYWDVYLAKYDNAPGSTVLNMSAKNNAPDKKLPFICVTGVTFSNCTSEGMPTESAFSQLYKIADSVKNTIDRLVENNMVGSFTYKCQRLDYFYVADTTGLRKLLAHTYAKYFPDYIPYINIKQDKNWEAYLNFLYPNEETYEYMQNQKVVVKLQDGGINLTKKDRWIIGYISKQNKTAIVSLHLL